MGSLFGLVVVGGIMILEWLLPRVWCRALCPLGACYSIAGHKAIWRVRINPKTSGQIRCKQCQIRCPMGIPIMASYTLPGHESITHPSCIRCGDCIDICPNTVLALRARPFPKDDNSQADAALHLPILDSDQDATCNACESIAS
jgi:ferredoxin-type protein NapH